VRCASSFSRSAGSLTYGAQKNLEVNCGGLRTEIAVLRDQNSSLQAQLKQSKLAVEGHRTESAKKEAALLQRIEDTRKDLDVKCGDFRTRIAVLQEQNASLQVQLKQYRSDAEGKHEEFAAKEATLLQQIQEARSNLETNCGGLRTEIAVLREQNNILQVQLKQSKLDMEGNRKESTMKEAGLSQRIEEARKDLDREVRRGSEMTVQSDRDIVEARRQNADLQSRLAGLQTQLQAVPPPCTIHEREIEGLKSQLTRNGTEYEALQERSRSLNARYDSGDLVRTNSSFYYYRFLDIVN
jgi:chromosome segregation ATPase